jgi:hypothetical protein
MPNTAQAIMMPMMLRQPNPVRRKMRRPREVDGDSGSVSVFDVVVFMSALLVSLLPTYRHELLR